MTNPTPEALAELKAALRWTDDHLRSFADYHPEMRTSETEAIFWRNNQLLGTYPEPRQPDELSDSLTHRAVLDAHPTSEPLPDAVERVARALCNDETAREIAGQALADAYEDSEPEVQEYWRCIARAALSAMPASSGEVGQVVAYRYVHLDYAGRKVSRYGTHAERVNGRDPIEVHPLYERGDHLSTPSDHGWRGIESAPKDGTSVDLWIAPLADCGAALTPCRVPNCYWVVDYAAWYAESLRGEPLRVWHRVTHWRPHPAPPHRGTDGSAE